MNWLQFWRRRVVNPIVALLRQGITPEKIALSITLAVVLGVIPVLGSTSLLCFVAAAALRLNLPVIQLFNFLVYPLQLALWVVFMRLGGWIFMDRPLHISLVDWSNLVQTGVWNAITTLRTATMHALVAWLLLALIVSFVLYRILLPVLRRLHATLRSEAR